MKIIMLILLELHVISPAPVSQTCLGNNSDVKAGFVFRVIFVYPNLKVLWKWEANFLLITWSYGLQGSMLCAKCFT